MSMKRKKIKGLRKFVVCVLTLLLFLSISTPVFAYSVQEYSHGKLSRFNIELVIDGSGSLEWGDDATDPKGLRYDAINLFLALLTNDGNDIGVIVFDDNSDNYLLNTGLKSVSGKDEKINMSDAVRKAGTGNDTDIGSALLTAVTELTGKNDERQSVVILMSDGRTDLGDDKDAYDRSLESKENAIVLAQENNIPIYTLCLNASPVADPAELEEISSRTNGETIVVNRAEDIADAFKKFYSLIFSTSEDSTMEDVIPAKGELEYDFNVPHYGAEEVNIILNSQGITSEELTSPSGKWSNEKVADSTMVGGIYRVIKLVDPEAGKWHIKIKGQQGDKVLINIVYNINTEAMLSTEDGALEYELGKTATLNLSLVQEGLVITDPEISKEYKAEMLVENLTTNETESLKMSPDGKGGFSCNYSPDDYAAVKLTAKAWCESFSLESNELRVNFGNSAPALTEDAKDAVIKVIVTPITGRKKNIDVSKYFKDSQDSVLDYSLVSSTLVKDTAVVDGSSLKVETAKSKSGDVIVRATDSQGAYTDAKIRFKVTNLTIPIIVIILGVILAASIIGFLGYKASQPVFHGTFRVANVQNGMGMPRGDFRGKISLKKFPVGNCGLDLKNTVFIAQKHNGLELHAKKPFYVNGMSMDRARLFQGENEIWADEQQTQGIIVTVTIR